MLLHVRRQRVEHVERQLEAVAFFGVDRQVDVGARGEVEQRHQARHELAHDALTLRVFVARDAVRDSLIEMPSRCAGVAPLP